MHLLFKRGLIKLDLFDRSFPVQSGIGRHHNVVFKIDRFLLVLDHEITSCAGNDQQSSQDHKQCEPALFLFTVIDYLHFCFGTLLWCYIQIRL